jgi:hypothetical protein
MINVQKQLSQAAGALAEASSKSAQQAAGRQPADRSAQRDAGAGDQGTEEIAVCAPTTTRWSSSRPT